MAGTQGESSGNVQNEEVPAKKKRMSLSFKAFRSLFSRRKRTKSKDEKITEEAEGPLCEQKHLSLSHDSVFMEREMRNEAGNGSEDKQIEATRSMTNLGPPNKSLFSAELSKAVKGRRTDVEEEEGEEEEQVGSNINVSAQLHHEELKSDTPGESDHSMLSMGDSSGEEEEDLFNSKWSGPGSAKVSSSDHSDDNELDLNMVKSSSSLNTKILDHKRAVRPKNVRPISKHPRAGSTRTTSPKPPVGSVQVLPLVEEEAKPEAQHSEEEDSKDEDIEIVTTLPSDDDIPKPKPLEQSKQSKPKSPTEDKKPVEIVIAKPSSPKEEKTDEKKVSSVRARSPRPTSPQKDKVDDSEAQHKPAFGSVVLRKTSQREVKTAEGETKAKPSVVLRSSTPGLRHDPSKRTTIALGADVSVFGERKVSAAKRSSLGEAKNWEEGKKEEEDSGEKVNEFADVFKKFQRKTSVKLIELQKEGETLEESHQKEKKKVSSPETKRVESKETKQPQNVQKKVEFAKPSTVPEAKVSPQNVLKKVEFAKTSTVPETKVSPAKPSSVTEKKVSPVKPATVTEKKVSVGKVEAKNTASSGTSVTAPKTVTLVIEKEKTKETVLSNEDKENKGYKRSSPLMKNRARSATLPEQPISQAVLDKKTENEASPKPIKKASSQEENSMKQKSSTSPTSTGNSPQRSASVLVKSSSQRNEPKRLIIKSTGDSGGAEPAWFEAARKKRSAFTGPEGEDKEKKDQENNAKKKEEVTKAPADIEPARSNRKSSVLDMVSKWQQS